MSEFNYIIVDGLIKTGKTKLAKILAQQFGARLVLDNKDNPFLKDYYTTLEKDENSLNLKTQLIFLLNRYTQQLEIKQKGLFQKMKSTNYM